MSVYSIQNLIKIYKFVYDDKLNSVQLSDFTIVFNLIHMFFIILSIIPIQEKVGIDNLPRRVWKKASSF
jgi:hypothetical protein